MYSAAFKTAFQNSWLEVLIGDITFATGPCSDSKHVIFITPFDKDRGWWSQFRVNYRIKGPTWDINLASQKVS